MKESKVYKHENYKDLAIREMQKQKFSKYKISPRFIRKWCGQSQLARRSNNHFGIKCGSNWRGKTTDIDDHYMECFRSIVIPENHMRIIHNF